MTQCTMQYKHRLEYNAHTRKALTSVVSVPWPDFLDQLREREDSIILHTLLSYMLSNMQNFMKKGINYVNEKYAN